MPIPLIAVQITSNDASGTIAKMVIKLCGTRGSKFLSSTNISEISTCIFKNVSSHAYFCIPRPTNNYIAQDLAVVHNFQSFQSFYLPVSIVSPETILVFRLVHAQCCLIIYSLLLSHHVVSLCQRKCNTTIMM